LETDGTPPRWVADLMSRVEAAPDTRLPASALEALGITPERARRWFKGHYGMSFARWCRSYRLACAFSQVRQGSSLDDVTFGTGFESHSGFREAFTRTFGEAPGRSRVTGSRILTRMIEGPVGPLLAGANDEGICFLHYAQPGKLQQDLARIQRQFGCALVPGEHRFLDRLREELTAYFRGELRAFTLPLAPSGTPFQLRVWSELGKVGHGETISYEALARRIGQPTAQRAVASANRLNRICILIPCHRVIGKNGSLTGYGGGLWRKRLLLELERTGTFPGQATKP
jgi:AraC family transcriptional regulator of adaptative response/methylated-DNA-[protein]-cysteine methyltransferase